MHLAKVAFGGSLGRRLAVQRAGRVLSGAEGAVSAAAGRPLKGLTLALAGCQGNFFFWLCSGFPLEGISLRLCDKTLYKEQPFYFTPTAPTAAGADQASQARSRGRGRSGSHRFPLGQQRNTPGRWRGSLGSWLYFGWCLLHVSSALDPLGMLGFRFSPDCGFGQFCWGSGARHWDS